MRPYVSFLSSGMSLCLMKYIVLVHFTPLPTPCAKFPISFRNYLVRHSQISLLGFLVMCLYYIALHVSSSMIASVYLGGVFFAVVSIFISASKILRRLFSASVVTWYYGASCISNSEASSFTLYVRDLRVLCCGGAVSGLNICGVGHFLGVVGIVLVVGSTLGAGMVFQDSWNCGIYLVQFFPSPPLELPQYSPSYDCMC